MPFAKIETVNSRYSLTTINVREQASVVSQALSRFSVFNPTHVDTTIFETGNANHPEWYRVMNESGEIAFVSTNVVTITHEELAGNGERFIVDIAPESFIVDRTTLTVLQNTVRNLLSRLQGAQPYD